MKVLGQVEIIGRMVIQIDSFPKSGNFELKAPVGAIAYESYDLAFEKVGKGDDEWERTSFRPTIQNVLAWSPMLTELSTTERKKLTDLVVNGVENFKQGEPSKEGREAVKFLTEDCIFIGFTSQIQYVMEQSRGQGSLDYIWEHPFSIPSLLLKHKRLPFLIIANGNLDFDDGRMRKSKYNDKEEPFNGISG
ncbi:MAG: hypothetical protein ABFD07_14610 [Methanobacterium sp.]